MQKQLVAHMPESEMTLDFPSQKVVSSESCEHKNSQVELGKKTGLSYLHSSFDLELAIGASSKR
jgi:hypothetical protein